jgi:site-specific recombinase XerD
MNAFCRWLHDEHHLSERLKLKKLRVEQRVLVLLTDLQIRHLLAFKPKTFRQHRTRVAVCLVLDTGLRVSEMLALRRDDVDFSNLILRVFGKGRKERLVPFSPELRKRLLRFDQLRTKKDVRSELVFDGLAAPAGKNATARRRCISSRTSSGSRVSAGTGCATRLPPTTSARAATSCGCRWC